MEMSEFLFDNFFGGGGGVGWVGCVLKYICFYFVLFIKFLLIFFFIEFLNDNLKF